MSRIAATLALILTLLTGAAATVASKARDEATLARCLAGCAVRFVPNRTVERRLLSGETRTERDDANEQYHLCSLGCNMPVFAGPFSSVLVGRELYQQAKELPMEELPQILSRVDPVCVKAMDDSTTLLLALDLLDKHHASPYICRMDVWAKTLATSEPTIVHSEYTMKPHYSLKHKLQPQASYQFRVNCYSFDGKLGQQVQSEWFLSDQLVPSTTPLNIVLDREESVDGHVSSLLSWNKPSGSLPFCEQRMYLTSKQTQMRIVELDESRRINLSKLNFETDYLLKIVPEKGDPRETRGLKFTTGACHKLSNRSEFCLPHGVRSLHAFHDAPTDRLFIAWSYTEAESAEDISFLVTVRLGARVIHEEVVKRTDRTAFVNLDHRSGNYEIDVVVIDLKNRRSPPSVTKFVPPNNRGHWILTLLAVSIGLVIILLLVTSLAFGYYIRNRNREAPQTDETHLMEAGAEAASQETVEPTMYFSTPLNRIKVNAQPKSCFRNTNREVISEIGSSSSLPKLDLSTSLNGNEKYFRFPIIETPTASEDGFKVAHLPDGRRKMVILYIKNARQIDGDVNINGQSLRVDRLIASGSRMNVYVAYCEGRSYIVKQILVLERQQWPCVRHEVSVQRELEEHPNVVKILGERGFSEHASAEGIAGQHLLLLERAMYGDVEDVVRKFGRFEYKTAWKFFGQIVSVIGEMHRNGYYHGGVAPRNVFVFSKKLCKVGDFGNGNKLVPEFFNSQRITVKEIRDLLGAVDTLVSMLLGREPWSVKHHDSEEYQDFVGVEQPEDYERFVAKYPDWGSVMYMGDFWYIRKFYWENDSGAFFNIPIPVEYGKLRADELREFGQINVPKPIFDD